ncbi:D-alanine--D-serine ligase VanG [Radiobacillus sp. PE A8.2]|uniref:D-alanine--D-serine ligase VanG n=1 Tax=Radiobacillus sp. PE A8.2 TaxID=3380349 RepID=UPI00388E3E82
MAKKRVVLLFGGCSSEYDVSLQSAYAVISNMNETRYETILIGITRDGTWLRYYGDAVDVQKDTWQTDEVNCVPVMFSPDRHSNKIVEIQYGNIKETKIDIVFPILHGINGEDGTVQGLLELAGIPFVGCDTISSALCMDKDRAHKLVELAGIQTAKAIVLDSLPSELELINRCEKLSYPLFVKPVRAGSSFGITKVIEEQMLAKAVVDAFYHDSRVIIEENIDGFEVGCAILGNDDLMLGEIDCIELEDGFFDYEEKYTLKTSKIHMPAPIEQEVVKKIKVAAVTIYRALGCCGLARVDMFLTPDMQIVFNEVNTFPGFTTHSRYPNMMKGAGLAFTDMIDKLIQLGLEK